jgi:ABC-2 type transport system ATP-binding protein
MNEMAVTADHLIVIGRGKLLAETSTQEFIERSSEKYVLVRSPDVTALADLIVAAGGKAEPENTAEGQTPALRVSNLDAPRIGEIAAADRIVLHELTPRLASLEEAYMELTADSLEYGLPAAGQPAPATGQPAPAAQPASSEQEPATTQGRTE